MALTILGLSGAHTHNPSAVLYIDGQHVYLGLADSNEGVIAACSPSAAPQCRRLTFFPNSLRTLSAAIRSLGCPNAHGVADGIDEAAVKPGNCSPTDALNMFFVPALENLVMEHIQMVIQREALYGPF